MSERNDIIRNDSLVQVFRAEGQGRTGSRTDALNKVEKERNK